MKQFTMNELNELAHDLIMDNLFNWLNDNASDELKSKVDAFIRRGRFSNRFGVFDDDEKIGVLNGLNFLNEVLEKLNPRKETIKDSLWISRQESILLITDLSLNDNWYLHYYPKSDDLRQHHIKKNCICFVFELRESYDDRLKQDCEILDIHRYENFSVWTNC